mgnify:FL=1
MTITEMSEMIMRDIADYKDAKRSGNEQEIEWAINNMENSYIMVCCRSVPGSELLRKTILEAREGN